MVDLEGAHQAILPFIISTFTCLLKINHPELSSPSLELKVAMKMIIAWCVDRFRYYIVFSKSLLFILGLVFSFKLVEKSLFDILITHLTDEWEDYNVRKAVMLVNLQEGTEAVVQIFFAFVADAYTGLFKMVVCSTTFYIIGLSLSCFAAWEGGSLNLRVFYPALVLMTLSQAAKKVTLKAFLGDQLATTEEEEERVKSRTKFWWYSVSSLAATVALFGPSRIDSLRLLSMVSAIAMGAAFLWFLLGTKFYIYVERTGSPLSDVGFVIRSAIAKRNAEYPQQIPPHVPWLRWLDRAAVGYICTVEQVKGVKYLIKMVPMWITFITFSLVAASGSTFFLEEVTSITDKNFPILFFTSLQRFTEIIVSEISDYVLEKLGKKYSIAQRMMLVRIGVGMIFCVLCCIAAWTNAVHRLRLLRMHRDPQHYMSVFRLTPQYLLLATMEGLSQGGLENFFDSQVSKSISRYGPPFGEYVMGIGKFVSVVCAINLSRWFKDDINSSHLDMYYAVLTILSCANITLYCSVAYWYGDDTFLSEEEVDIEMADYVVQVDSLGETGQYSHRSLSGRIAPIPEENGNGSDDAFEKKQQDRSLPLLKLETGQETTEFSDNELNDHEAEKLKSDVIGSMDQVSTLDSESTKIGPSDGPTPSETRSFSRVSSSGIHKRSNSMRRS